MERAFRSFAIVPAAGHSRRMGRPKLLLPWDGSTVIETVIRAWRASRVAAVIVVARRDDVELLDRCHAAGAEVVAPGVPPAEMKDSVRLGLDYVGQRYRPRECDVWLLAPADMPRLSAPAINGLLDAHDPTDASILVPLAGGRRGHPVLFPWPVAADVANLPADSGVNSLLTRHSVREVPACHPGLVDDLDTPADYVRLQGEWPVDES